MPSFLTPNLNCYALKFSPFFLDKLAVTACENFGFTGGGTLILFTLSEGGHLQESARAGWSNGLFDLAWSGCYENLIALASGDGTVQVRNVNDVNTPVAVFQEHALEAQSLDWNQTFLVSGSWDSTVKFWDTQQQNSIRTFQVFSPVHCVSCSPTSSTVFGCVTANGYLRIWDLNSPVEVSHANIHNGDVLTCAWSPHDSNIIITGGSDCSVKGWDTRNINSKLFELSGCEYPIRKVQCSPHHRSKLASVSYDLTTRVWDWQGPNSLQETFKHHSEFVYGLDFNRHIPGQIGDCGWDSLVHVFNPKSLINR